MNECSCRVTSHSSRQLEIGVVYPVPAQNGAALYTLDAYVFTPFHLGLTSAHYGAKAFFNDLSSYIRYTSASIPLAKLLDAQCELSPLVRIRRMLQAATSAHDLEDGRLLYELRVLVNTYHAQTRETRRVIGGLVREACPADDVGQRLALFLGEASAVLQQFRELRPRFLDSHVPQMLQQGMAWADESMSLKTEKECFRLYELCGRRPDLMPLRAGLVEKAAAEQQYRAARNYATVIDPAAPQSGESLLYRESVLKKWAQTAMYMEAVPNPAGARIAHILAGVAAAIAMAFAVAATFLAERLFASYSLPWALLIVVAYIFKDRIKEVLRNLMAVHLPKLVSDEIRDIVDSRLGRKVGAIRSSVRFCFARDLPDEVVRMRDAAGNPFNAIMPPENILHYHSALRLDCPKLRQGHHRLEAITNILRLKLTPWLAAMDDPTSNVSYVNDGEVAVMQANRVYHANLVVRIAARHDASIAITSKYRLVLNRDGIVRIETP
jgi:hypothetical protein